MMKSTLALVVAVVALGLAAAVPTRLGEPGLQGICKNQTQVSPARAALALTPFRR